MLICNECRKEIDSKIYINDIELELCNDCFAEMMIDFLASHDCFDDFKFYYLGYIATL